MTRVLTKFSHENRHGWFLNNFPTSFKIKCISVVRSKFKKIEFYFI
jgi:hypothetical protein